MKLNAFSDHRFNGGVRAKRAYGSSTVTVFRVFDETQKDGPVLYVEAYGATPGERKAVALRAAEPYFTGQLPRPEGNAAHLRTIKAYP